MKAAHVKSRIFAFFLSAAMAFPLFSVTAYAAEEYDQAGATVFAFSNTEITAANGSYTDYEIDGTSLSIQGGGVYILSGACEDGSVVVKKGVTDVVLVLDGVELSSGSTAPITCNKSSQVTLVAASGTTNTLTDTARNNDEVYPDNELAENAVLKCKDGSQVTICGSGSLNINANGKNGIKSGETTEEEGEAWLTIEDVKLNINATVNDGINAEATLKILSGDITVSAADDGIHSDYALEIGAAGTPGPNITVSQSYEGLEAADIAIYSGTIEVHAEDDGINAANSDLSDYPFSLTIAGGTVYVDAETGDGLDSNGSITISDGTVTVFSTSSGDNQPLDSDGLCTISGGTVLAVGNGGMGTKIDGTQPYVAFGSVGRGGGGKGMGGPDDNGGRGDGSRKNREDSNRDQPPAPQTAPNGAAAVSAGSTLSIQNSAGETVSTGTAVRDANYVLFSSPAITSGDSYTLFSENTEIATGIAETSPNGASNTVPAKEPNMQPPPEPKNPEETPADVPETEGSSTNALSAKTNLVLILTVGLILIAGVAFYAYRSRLRRIPEKDSTDE